MFVVMGCAATGPLSAQTQTIPIDPCAGEDKVVVDVLDPALDATRKSQPLQAMQALASAGCGDAAWVLGNMHRFGPELPGTPLPKDVSSAKEFLAQAGLAGMEAAYRDQAELALAQENARDAMLWTQVLLWLKEPEAGTGHRTAHGYDADLLKRVTRAWRADGLDNAQIKTLLSTYVTEHGDELLAARRSLAERTRNRPRLALAKAPRVHPGNIGRLSGYVMFRMEAKPSGEVTRVVIESYGPSAEVVDRLRPLVKTVRLMPFAGTETVTGTLPIVAAISP
jgi:hypothetical protein